MLILRILWSYTILAYAIAATKYYLQVSDGENYALLITSKEGEVIVSNLAILVGATDQTEPVYTNSSDTTIEAEMITPTVAKVSIKSDLTYIGASFFDKEDTLRYGVWGYPWDGKLINENISYDLKGLQTRPGINYMSVRAPFFISSAGYAVYTDTQQMGHYNFSGADNQVQFVFNTTGASPGELTYYIILPYEKGEFKSLFSQYAGLTDTTSLFAPSAYGPMWWHDDWTIQAGYPEGVQTAQEFVQKTGNALFEKRIRASAIMLDCPYGTGTEGWGNWDFSSNYTDPRTMVDELSKMGIDFNLWVANRAVEDSVLYENADPKWLFLESSIPSDTSIALNLSIPEAFNYFKNAIFVYSDLGTRGYKIDRGDEDEMPVWEQNIQSFLFHKLLFESQAEKWGAATKDKPLKFYNYARSVNDRSRKYTGVWAADPRANEVGLVASIRSAVRCGLIGMPMWGSDTGGYVNRMTQNIPTEELFARWMWFSAFSPVYETMLAVNTNPLHDYSEDLITVLRETTDLHHELIPYIQSYIHSSTIDSVPVIRALFLEVPEDPNIWEADETYFFGQEFLIAPIVSGGQKVVYFPQGGSYLEYFNKTDVYKGGSEAALVLDVHAVPAFVREGAIVPRGDLYRFNNYWTEDWKPWLNIELYPSYAIETSSFVYYVERAGVTVNIKMRTDQNLRRVCVEYGAIGVEGKLRFFIKGGPKEVDTVPEGTEGQCIEQVDSVFD